MTNQILRKARIHSNYCRFWQPVLAPTDLCPGAIVSSRWRPTSPRSTFRHTTAACLVYCAYQLQSLSTPWRFSKKGGKSGDAFSSIRILLCAQFSCVLEGSEFNTTLSSKFQTILDGHTDFEFEIIINWFFLKKPFQVLMLCNFEQEDDLRKTNLKGCGREGSCHYIQASGQIEGNHETQHFAQYFRPEIRTRDHPNSKYEHKGVCLLDFHLIIYWWICRSFHNLSKTRISHKQFTFKSGTQ